MKFTRLDITHKNLTRTDFLKNVQFAEYNDFCAFTSLEKGIGRKHVTKNGFKIKG